ncbi:MAG: hypothetical protein WCT28_04665 [Patescibacteria group bacterium]|jgi:hypothetical protein
MTREEANKKYQAYDKALSTNERMRAAAYRKYTYVFLMTAWVSPILFIGLGSAIRPTSFAPNLQGWMMLIGVILCVVSLGLFLIFGGKDVVLRKYSLGQEYTTYNKPLFDDAAVRWGRAKIVTGYVVIISLTVLLSIVAFTMLFFPH